MDIDRYLHEVAVIGAAGKMGSGIALLLAELMAQMSTEGTLPVAARLRLVDTRPQGLEQLRTYLETQMQRRAQRRGANDTAARRGVEQAFSFIQFTTEQAAVAEATILFEAVPESEDLKSNTLRALRETCSDETLFLSNTSSIPIWRLDEAAGLDGRLIGFHFYNPPAVQRLLELIPATTTRPLLVQLAQELARRLGKTLVPSRDVAGFVGNGHFVREGLHAAAWVEQLTNEFDEAGAIYAVNRVSEEGLLRPMGIFQVIDYAGVDIFTSIMDVMERYIDGESFASPLLRRLSAAGVRGGQHGDGTQKDGIFQYDGRRRVGVYDAATGGYRALDDGRLPAVDVSLGELAGAGCTWREIRERDASERQRLIGEHASVVSNSAHRGAVMAREFAAASRDIARKLVADGIATSAEDVNTVVVQGFHHLYGPLDETVRY